MKRVLTLTLVVAVVLTMLAPAVWAAPGGPAGKSEQAHLYLYEKDPGDWSIVDGGAWGKLSFGQEGETFDFVFNGHGLVPATEYSLIYYADPWPGAGSLLIASGTANEGGNLHLAGSAALGTSLPVVADANYPDGAKIWLVLSADFSTTMTAWNPTSYLFEDNLITYTYEP